MVRNPVIYSCSPCPLTTMLLLGLFFATFPGLFYCDICVPSDQVVHDPRAPTLGIRVFSDYSKAILTGHNFSVTCTSNKSKEYIDFTEEAQPEEISMFFGNSTPIKVCGSADEETKDTKTCTLVISNATLMSSGYYSCMAANFMRCTKATIIVKVEEPSPPNITIYPMGKQLMIASGHHFNLSCEAEGTPPPRISWFKDGSRITSTSTEHGRRTSVMSFMPVRPENQGRYWCEANSTEGWTQSPSVFLKVLRRPYFVIHPEDVSVYEGENVTMSCLATGFPAPVIGWLKNNESIDNFSSVGGNSSLAFSFLERQATNSKYRCVASNSLGKTYSSKATLTVLTRQTTRDKANEKTSSKVFNPAWAWLGAVVAILLLSTAVVVIRKFKHGRRNTTNEDDHATNSEVVTGYSRF